ncbi:MAG: hypothetical protein PSN37_00860 [Alphaproteobacteria bacterium]|nr:hypothetical protein [Alphaproteobacteria bacterium]
MFRPDNINLGESIQGLNGLLLRLDAGTEYATVILSFGWLAFPYVSNFI